MGRITLTIQPGVVIYGETAATYLAVNAGATIVAGTQLMDKGLAHGDPARPNGTAKSETGCDEARRARHRVALSIQIPEGT